MDEITQPIMMDLQVLDDDIPAPLTQDSQAVAESSAPLALDLQVLDEESSAPLTRVSLVINDAPSSAEAKVLLPVGSGTDALQKVPLNTEWDIETPATLREVDPWETAEDNSIFRGLSQKLWRLDHRAGSPFFDWWDLREKHALGVYTSAPRLIGEVPLMGDPEWLVWMQRTMQIRTDDGLLWFDRMQGYYVYAEAMRALNSWDKTHDPIWTQMWTQEPEVSRGHRMAEAEDTPIFQSVLRFCTERHYYDWALRWRWLRVLGLKLTMIDHTIQLEWPFKNATHPEWVLRTWEMFMGPWKEYVPALMTTVVRECGGTPHDPSSGSRKASVASPASAESQGVESSPSPPAITSFNRRMYILPGKARSDGSPESLSSSLDLVPPSMRPLVEKHRFPDPLGLPLPAMSQDIYSKDKEHKLHSRHLPDVTAHVVSPDGMIHWLEQLTADGKPHILAFDVETAKDRDVLTREQAQTSRALKYMTEQVPPGLDPYMGCIRLIQLAADTSPTDAYVLDWWEATVAQRESILRLLHNPSWMKMGFNIKFDLKMVYRYAFPDPVAMDGERRYLLSNPVDLMLAFTILEPGQFRSNLALVAWRWLKWDLDKTMQKSDWSQKDLSREQVEYAAKDVSLLFWLYDYALPRIRESRQEWVWEIENQAVAGIALGEYYGLPFLEDQWLVLKTEAEQRLQILEQTAKELLPRQETRKADEEDLFSLHNVSVTEVHPEWNIGSPDQVKQMLNQLARSHQIKIWNPVDPQLGMPAEADGCPVIVEWSDGNVQRAMVHWIGSSYELVDPETLVPLPKRNTFASEKTIRYLAPLDVKDTNEATLLQLQDIPELKDVVTLILDYREVTKKLNNYLVPYLDLVHPLTGRIHASYGQNRAVTGRMSSNKPNAQQLPHGLEYRACFGVRGDEVAVIADYSQIELRIVADMSQDPDMIEAYLQGGDLHSKTAANVNDIPEDEFLRMKKDPAHAKAIKDMRQAAKAVNFGFMYGMGAPKFRLYAKNNYGVDLTEDEAKTYRNKYFAGYAGVKRWHDDMAKIVIRRKDPRDWKSAPQGLLETRTRSGRVRHYLKEKVGVSEVYNTPVQGTGADMLKSAIGVFARIISGDITEYYGHHIQFRHRPKFAAFVHDEIFLTCHKDDAAEVAMVLQSVMEHEGQQFMLDVPVLAEPGIGDSWSAK